MNGQKAKGNALANEARCLQIAKRELLLVRLGLVEGN